MNIEIINSLKQRAKEMLENNYNRKIGDEEVYTIICELENFYTAYEKEKEKYEKIYNDIINKNEKLVESLNYKIFIENKIKAKIEEVKDGTFDAEIILHQLLEKE